MGTNRTNRQPATAARAAIAALNAFTHIIDAATAALIHAGQHRGNPGEK